MTDLPSHIQALLSSRSRELQIALDSQPSNELSSKPQVNSTFAREGYKDKKSERFKHSSRDCEDDELGKVAVRPASWPEAAASGPMAFDSVISPRKSQEAVGNGSTPREFNSRYSGISVQHANTKQGIKLYITLQCPEWRDEGQCQLVTAELKRFDRLREVKARIEDSEIFAKYLDHTKQSIQQGAIDNQSIKKTVCLGRLHQRNRRSKWLYDTLAVGFMDQDKIFRVMLYLEGEEYEINLDRDMSDNQRDKYLSHGYYGDIKQARSVPRLNDLPLHKFGG